MKKKYDDGRHIDVRRMHTSSAQDHDWKPTTGPAFRVRDESGAFKLHSDGLPVVHGSKKRKI